MSSEPIDLSEHRARRGDRQIKPDSAETSYEVVLDDVVEPDIVPAPPVDGPTPADGQRASLIPSALHRANLKDTVAGRPVVLRTSRHSTRYARRGTRRSSSCSHCVVCFVWSVASSPGGGCVITSG